MQLSDRVTGAVIATVGVVAAWAGSRLPDVPGQDVGPSVFPMAIGAGMLICGVLIALGVGSALEVPEEGPRHGWLYGLRALLPPALLLFYMLMVDLLGFLITAAVIIGVTAAALGARLRLALPLAVLAPLLVHAVFVKLLRVPLPEGLMAIPW